MRKTVSEKIAISVAALIALVGYARIFFCIGTLDESQYLASAFMTSLGGRPFYNELFFQQGASLLYEPLAWLYYQAFGTTAAQLAFRHLYFLVFATWGWVTFRYFQKRVSLITALAIGLLPVSGAMVVYASLSYNSMGMSFFGLGAIFLLRAIEERRMDFTILTGFALFVSVVSYPTYVVIWTIFTALVAFYALRERMPFLRTYFVAATLGAILSVGFFGLCILRFGWEEFVYSLEFSRAFSTFGAFDQKVLYAWYLFRGFAPPWWQWGAVVAVWWPLNRWFRVPWVAVIPALWFMTAIQEPPERGPYSPAVMVLLTLSSLFMLPSVNWRKRMPEIALWVTGVLGAPLFVWTSSMTFYMMYLSLVFTMMAVLALSEDQRSGRSWSLLAFTMPAFFLYFFVAENNLDDDPIVDQTEYIESGYFKGLHTSKVNYDFLKQWQEDINLCGQKGRSVLFYDLIAAGYMMTDMRPATRSLVMHGLGMSWKVRHTYTEYYSNPAVRPDCVFRFSRVRAIDGVWLDNDPKKYAIRDVFWNYLPEETGAYFPLKVRDTYTVYQKKGL